MSVLDSYLVKDFLAFGARKLFTFGMNCPDNNYAHSYSTIKIIFSIRTRNTTRAPTENPTNVIEGNQNGLFKKMKPTPRLQL